MIDIFIGYDIREETNEVIAVIGANRKDAAGKNIALELHEGNAKKRIPRRPFLAAPVASATVQKALEIAATQVLKEATQS